MTAAALVRLLRRKGGGGWLGGLRTAESTGTYIRELVRQ